MSMAAHPSRNEIVGGINGSEDALKSGPNQNCRVYNIENNKYVYLLHSLATHSPTCPPGSHFHKLGAPYI